jgi:hypothetical protein
MNKKKVILCAVLSLIVMLSGCAKKTSDSRVGSSVANPAEAKMEMTKDSIMKNNSTSSTDEVTKDKETKQNSEQKIIRNGNVYIVEEDLVKLAEDLQAKTKELGGYIESEDLMEYRLTVKARIPSNKFDDFIKYTEKGYEVKNKNISSENITDSYVDNDARLNNLKAQEKQILTILEKAKTVEEVLKVQAELYRIRGEAEALEARKKSWDKQVDYATLIINADKKQIVSDNKKSIIKGSEFIKAIGKGFSNTWISLILFIQNLLIFVLSNIIVLALLVLAGIFGFKKYKKYSNIHKK